MTEYQAPGAPPLTFTEMDGTDVANIGSGTGWTAWDMSALVPATAQSVAIATASASAGFATRATGSGLNRININSKGWQMCQLSAARSIDLKNASVGPHDFCLMGYWS